MIKTFFLAIAICFAILSNAQVTKTVDVTAGSLKTILTTEELNTVTNLTLTGNIDARDFKTMRDDMPVLADIDLSGATIVAYSGTEGTWDTEIREYPANNLPNQSFFRPYFPGKIDFATIVLPNNLTAIGDYVFLGCISLSSVTIPTSVTSIGAGAFSACSRLSSVKIPTSVTCIENNTFQSCPSLSSVTIPESVTSIGIAAFKGCSSLSSVTIPASVTNIGNYAFASCSSLKSIYANSPIPVNLINAYGVFLYGVDMSICTLYVPYGSKAAYQAAYQWKDFTNIVEMPDLSSKSIMVSAGGLSTALTAEELASVTKLTITGTIDARDFKTMRDNMPLLAEIDLRGVTIVAYNGNEGTSSYGNSYYPANTIPQYAFVDYSNWQAKRSLTTIVFPNSLTAIGSTAFNCTSLSSVTIPASVTSIGESAFGGCPYLSSITIPASVTRGV